MKLAVEYTGMDGANYRVPKSRIIDTDNSSDVDWLIFAMTGEGYYSDSPKDCRFYNVTPAINNEDIVLIAKDLKQKKDSAITDKAKAERKQQYEELKKEFEP